MTSPPRDTASDDLPQALRFVLSRRSATMLQGPAPTQEQVALLLRATLTVPDHGLLRPFRFVVVEGEQRALFGDALAAAAVERNPALAEPVQQKLREKALLAPMQLILIYSPKQSPKIPGWEQQVAASCAGYAVVLAAHALGLGAIWKSALYMDGEQLRTLLGLTPGEQVLGWINLGLPLRAQEPPREPESLADIVSVLGPSGDRGPLQG